MKNIKYIFIGLSIFLSFVAGAQNQQGNVFSNLRKTLERADEHYDNYAYNAAIVLYKQVLEKDPSHEIVKLKIARAYKKINNSHEAEWWYRNAISENELTGIDQLLFAQTLMSIGKYDEAKAWLVTYTQSKKDIRALNNLVGLGKVASFFADSAYYQISNAPFNTAHNEFSSTYDDGKLLFLSDRKQTKPLQYTNTWTENGFYNLYQIKPNEKSAAAASLFNSGISSRYHEGPLAIFNAGQHIIFTRSISEKNSNGELVLGLFTAEKSKNGMDWINVQPFPHNNTAYSNYHPAISETGDTLFFSSQIPGGYGGGDIYFSIKKEGIWTQPENMGSQINTEGNEHFSYLKDNILYFASDGHQGLGGLDIYWIDIKKQDAYQVINPGFPINSSYDDLGLTFATDKTGAFSSNRPGGKGNDDIYFFEKLDAARNQIITINGFVFDKITGEAIGDASIYVIDEISGEDFDLIVNEKGKFSFSGIAGHSYTVLADNAFKSALVSDLVINQPTDVIEIGMWGFAPPLPLQIAVYDKETGYPVKLATVHLLEDEKPVMQEVTSIKGEVSFLARSDMKLTLQVVRAGYKTALVPVDVPAGQATDPWSMKVIMDREKPLPVQIKGIVLDTTLQAGINDISVYIINEKTGERLQLLTRKDGTFEFEGIVGEVYKAVTANENKTVVVSDIRISDPSVAVNDNIVLALSSFTNRKLENDEVAVKVLLTDKQTGEPLEFGIIKLLLSDTVRQSDYTDLDGTLMLPAREGIEYAIKSDVQGYREETMRFTAYAGQDQDTLILSMRLEKTNPGLMQGVVIDHEASAPVQGVQVLILNEKNGLEQAIISGPHGEFAFQATPGDVVSILGEEKETRGDIRKLVIMEHHFNAPLKLRLYATSKRLKIEVMVTDKNSGEGVPVADIKIFQNETIFQTRKTDVGGMTRLEVQSDKIYKLSISHRAYKSMTLVVDNAMAKDGVIRLDVVMEKQMAGFTAVKGLAYHSSEKPVVGARITVIDEKSGLQKSLQSDKEGQFEFMAKPGEIYNILGEHEGKTGMLPSIEVPNKPANQPVLLVLHEPKKGDIEPLVTTFADMQRRAALAKVQNSLVGYVFDQVNRVPARSANLYIINDNSGDTQTLTSDEQGIFIFKGVAGEQFSILADTDTQSGLYTYLKILNAKDTIQIGIGGMPPPIIIKVNVRQEGQKKPLKAASIAFLEDGKTIQQEISSISGIAMLRGYAGNSYEVMVSAPGYEMESKILQIPAQLRDTVDMTMVLKKVTPELISVKGTVVDDATNLPKENVAIFVMSQLTWDIQQLVSDKKGRFEFKALEGESFDVIAESKHQNASMVGAQFKREQADIVLRLKDNMVAENVVPFVNVSVRLAGEEGENLQGIIRIFLDDTVKQVTYTDRMGGKNLELLPGRNYFIEGSMMGYKSSGQRVYTIIENYQDTLQVAILLQKQSKLPVTIAGVVQDGVTQSAIAGAQIFIRNTVNGEEQELVADHEGRFSFQGLSGSTFMVLGEDTGLSGSITNFVVPDVLPTGLLNLRLFASNQAAIVKVILVDEGSKGPIKLAKVELAHQGIYQQNILSDQSGVGIFQAYAGKEYNLRINHPAYLPISRKISALEAFKDTIRVEIALQPKPPITTMLYAHVYDGQTNKPINAANVHIINDKTDEVLDFKADARGDFSFSATAGFTYMILADNEIRSGMISELFVFDPKIQPNEFIKIPVYGILDPVMVMVQVEDERTQSTLQNVSLNLYLNKALINQGNTVENGSVAFSAYNTAGYHIMFSKTGFNSQLISLDMNKRSGDTLNLVIKAVRLHEMANEGLFDEYDNKAGENAAIVRFMGTNRYFVSFDDEIYEYKQDRQKVYLDNSKKQLTISENNSPANAPQQVLKDHLLNKNVKAENIDVQHVFYDFDRFSLSPVAIAELKKVAFLMQKHKNIKLELRAFTDIRGSDDYNLRLARKRANEAFNYLVHQGIEKSRINRVPVGKANLNKDCNGKPCTESDHTFNRRTEMMIKYTLNLISSKE